MDPSVQPPSYGIELDGSYRETEASRLAPLPVQAGPVQGKEQPPQEGGVQEGEAVEGLGHWDAATEAKEAAARKLEE